MNKKMKMFIVCAVFILIGACKIHTSYDEQSNGEINHTSYDEQSNGEINHTSYDEQSNGEINHTLYDEQSNGELKLKKIEFSKFTVKIKNKDNNSNWTDLGDLVVRKEENGIDTGLNAGGHSATFFSLKESEVNNFVKAMTEGGSFKTDEYYGYGKEQSNLDNGTSNKEIITKIEKIDGTKYITFSGNKIKDSGDKVAEYAILLEDLKKNLK
ncbi:regulator [Borreliella burgdorferi]|nr:regulator [Borreliella burgdorferi]